MKKEEIASASSEEQTEETVFAGEDSLPLTQSELEHKVYLSVCEKYDEYRLKRIRYRKYGVLFIILSALVFLALMFSLESKVTFLVLWIVTIIFCVVLMIRADYLYYMYSAMLGKNDENDDEKE